MQTICQTALGSNRHHQIAGFVHAFIRRGLPLWLAIEAAGGLSAAQLSLKHNVTPKVGGGYYQGVTDSWMDYQNKYNYGADYDLYVGEYESGVGDVIIMRFELPPLTFQSVASATLSLWYVDSYEMNYNNTALQVAPLRIKPGYSWYENTGGSGGGHSGGLANHGVNYWYRDANDTLAWTANYAGFYDSLDDGNGRQWIKRTGGTVPYALAPQQWVPFSVQPSVAQWYGGQENNGLGFYTQGYLGSDSIADGDFASHENTGCGPTLDLTYAGAQIAWVGASSATWDSASGNWNVGGYLGKYGDGDLVTFADGAGNPNVTISGGGVAPGSVTVNNSTTSFSFSGGAINGAGGFTKQGAGLATLSAPNTYGGLTVIRAGRLWIAANGALGGAGSGTVVSNGAALGLQGGVNYATAEPLTLCGAGGGGGALYAVSGSNTFAGPVTLAADTTIGVTAGLGLALSGGVAGGFGVTKIGGGRLTLCGADNVYTGPTVISQGTLALGVTAALPNSAIIDVAAGANLDAASVSGGWVLGAGGPQTLQGGGTISGNVSSTSLARLQPGDGTGTLTFQNDLNLAGGVTNYFELTNSTAIGGGTNDLIVVGGNLALQSNVVAITVLGSDPLGAGVYRLLNYSGAKAGGFNPTPVFLSGAPVPGVAVIDDSVTNQINLVIYHPISTTNGIASSPNPALPGASVTLTATVSALPPGTNPPSGVVTFRTNGVAMGAPVTLTNGLACVTSTGLPHGFTCVLAEYAGGGVFLGSTGSVVQLVNTPPVPGVHEFWGLVNRPFVLSVAALVSQDRDADLDPLTIVGISRLSTNSGTAALVSGTNLVCLPKPDYVGPDLITYTVSDSFTNVSVPVYLHLVGNNALAPIILGITNLGGGAVVLSGAGVPTWTNWLFSATNLCPPITWTTISTSIADTNGLWQCLDPAATNLQAYYRAAAPTNPPDYRLYDTEWLRLDISGGGLPPGLMLRESPALASPGVTLIRPLTNGDFTISSFCNVFTELTLNGGVIWIPAANGPLPLILVGGLPPNEFPKLLLPPTAGQHLSPPGGVEFYPQLVTVNLAIENLVLRSFTASFPPPPVGVTLTNSFSALADLSISFDGGVTFAPFTAPAQIQMSITGRR